MKFEIKNLQKSINDIMRTIGYRPAYFQNEGETSIIRPVGRNEYPRFHAYIKQNGQDFSFSLHIDQKKASYEGSTGHSGDYDGDVVEGEARRIQDILMRY